MLNFLPLPNYVDPINVNNSNYKSTYTGAYPKREDMVRIDYNITPSLQVYWRYVQDKDEQQVPYGLWVNGNINYLLAPITFGQPGKGHVAHITKSITPHTGQRVHLRNEQEQAVFLSRRMLRSSTAPRSAIPDSGIPIPPPVSATSTRRTTCPTSPSAATTPTRRSSRSATSRTRTTTP